MDIAAFRKKVEEYLPSEKLPLINQAIQFALKAHEGQVRKSGEPYLEHPIETAMILAELQLDASTLAAAILHDVCEDCKITYDEIEAKFGSEISKLVSATTKISKVSDQIPEHSNRGWKTDGRKPQAENLRKMLIAMAEDLRVVFIKLADRLHNMRTLSSLSSEKRHRIAQETLEIYAPLAHRLGIWKIKWQLEDLAFRYLEPRQYHKIARLIATRRAQRESFINNLITELKDELKTNQIKAEVVGRPKHIYSTYQKMRRYLAQDKDFGDIHDLFALRVLVDTVSDCYKTLGVIHNLWRPIPEEFSDFIANPKDNGYQSLHTTVISQNSIPLEIQIRTNEMHRVAEYGLAAHWRYKEKGNEDVHFARKIAWLRQLVDWYQELGSEEFLEMIKTDILIDQVFVFTPKGEIKDLPKGATPIDFAYRIHTELGHHCIGAKVNNKLVPLNYKLNNGDIIEIITTKTAKGPSLDWLNPNLGYVKTTHAREKIRQWFKKQERTQNIERGKHLLEKEIKRLGLSLTNPEEIAKLFNYENMDDFLAAIGYGDITPHQLALKLTTLEGPPATKVETLPVKPLISGVLVSGMGDLLTHLAYCCRPLPGDDIIGYITRNRGITVHRKDCYNILLTKDRERLVDVSWGSSVQVYPVDIQIEAWDRVGLLRDISTIIADEKVNITKIMADEHNNHSTSIFLTVEIKSMAQLNKLLSQIESIQGVKSALRRLK